MSYRRAAEHQKAIAPSARDLRGRLRRMAIKVTSRVLWQLIGHRTDDGRETVDVEVFPGVGFYARPRASDRAEAIVVNVGGAAHPAIVATRNEDVRKDIAALGEDETAMFNSQAIVHVIGDQIHVRLPGGTTKRLVTVDEHNGHTHPYEDDGTPGFTTGTPSSAAVGTSVLRGQ